MGAAEARQRGFAPAFIPSAAFCPQFRPLLCLWAWIAATGIKASRSIPTARLLELGCQLLTAEPGIDLTALRSSIHIEGPDELQPGRNS